MLTDAKKQAVLILFRSEQSRLKPAFVDVGSDYWQDGADKLLKFLGAISATCFKVCPEILRRHRELTFTHEYKKGQLRGHGRCAALKLVYDRGTRFGLMTGGNIETILVSMPAVVKW